MEQSSDNWCLNYSNDEIRAYFISELEKSDIPCSCIVGDNYVGQDANEPFEYITFDGKKQDFFISFCQCEVSIFFNEEEIMFIDNNEKKYYTIEDTFGNIVYEGNLNNLSHRQILTFFVSIIKFIYGSEKITVKKKPLSDHGFLYPGFEYRLLIYNPLLKSGIYDFENITFEINQ